MVSALQQLETASTKGGERVLDFLTASLPHASPHPVLTAMLQVLALTSTTADIPAIFSGSPAQGHGAEMEISTSCVLI